MLSIVIPTKNEEKYLGGCIRALKSALDRWDKDAEIIIIDNGSTDNTRAIARAENCLVILQNQGTIASLRNLGAENARGDILAFLDADCLVSPEWINFCLENFDNQKIAAVGTRAVPDLKNATWVERCWYRLMVGSRRPDFVKWLGTSNLFVRTKAFRQVAGFDETLETGEDVNLCLRLGKRYLIFLEKRVDTIHLRESKTIRELFKREYWRGGDSLKSYTGNNYPADEFLSVAVPLVNFFSLVLLVVFGGLTSALVVFPVMIVGLLPAALLLKKLGRIDGSTAVWQCYIIAFVYLFARTCSIANEIVKIVSKK